ncbi:MAG: hypothetical protein ACFFCS_26760 [Candidatus Hodarchaeota archaeon]
MRKDIPRDFLAYSGILDELAKRGSSTSRQLVTKLGLNRFYLYSLLEMLRRDGLVVRLPIVKKEPGGPKYTYRCTPSGISLIDDLGDKLQTVFHLDCSNIVQEDRSREIPELDEDFGYELSQEIGIIIQDYIEDGALVGKLVNDCVKVVASILRK